MKWMVRQILCHALDDTHRLRWGSFWGRIMGARWQGVGGRRWGRGRVGRRRRARRRRRRRWLVNGRVDDQLAERIWTRCRALAVVVYWRVQRSLSTPSPAVALIAVAATVWIPHPEL